MVDLTNVIFNLPAICLHLLAQNFVYEIPRSFATSSRVFNSFKPAIVARTTFCLLREPRDFVRIFLNPASSKTARAGPPAMIPYLLWRLFHQYGCTAELTNEVMRNTLLVLIQRYFDEFLHCVSFSLRIASGILMLFPNLHQRIRCGHQQQREL